MTTLLEYLNRFNAVGDENSRVAEGLINSVG